MKILIVSDIHANLEALEAVLAEAHDEMWVLGDLVNYGPNPSEVVDLIRLNASLVVQGNHDYAISAGADPQCSQAFREMARAMQDYTEPLLNADQKGVPARPSADRGAHHRRLSILSLPRHAQRSRCSNTAPPSPRGGLRRLRAYRPMLILTGHTHVPFTMDLENLRIVNPGSVGQPKHGSPMACYAVWENGRLVLKSCSYAVEETVGKVYALPVPLEIRRQLAAVLRSGSPPG